MMFPNCWTGTDKQALVETGSGRVDAPRRAWDGLGTVTFEASSPN